MAPSCGDNIPSFHHRYACLGEEGTDLCVGWGEHLYPRYGAQETSLAWAQRLPRPRLLPRGFQASGSLLMCV